MKYFFDTEFHEFKKVVNPLGIFKELTWTIDFLSIGIIAEDGREYYAICKEFDLKRAWKNQWLVDHALWRIYCDFIKKYTQDMLAADTQGKCWNLKLPANYQNYCYASLNILINHYGKTRAEIAEEVILFTHHEFDHGVCNWVQSDETVQSAIDNGRYNPEFYAYYADYDWVNLCWLFDNTMVNLPLGFPSYCKDLKQYLDTFDINREKVNAIPKKNNHNALSDAKWNKKMFDSLIAPKLRQLHNQ